jgi:hypothetical protein
LKLAPAAALAASFALSAAFAFRTAPGDAPDERAHAKYVLELRERGRLPEWNYPADPDSYEAHQPPLYYALAAAFTLPVRSAPALTQLRAMRLFSAILHVLALWAAWLLFSSLGAGPGPLAAMLAVPMFAFIGGTVTNDAAANAASALLLAAAFTGQAPPRRRALVVGLVSGAALLCKATVIPIVGIALLSIYRQKRDWRAAAVAASLTLAVAGGWYLRNALRFHDPIGYGGMSSYDTHRFAWSESGRWALLFFESFWGRFGRMTRPMPWPAYALACVLTLGALAGWAKHGRKLASRPKRGWLALAAALAVGQNIVYGFFLSYQPQARFSFIALAPLALLAWDGLSVWFEGKPRRFRRGAAAAGLAAAAALQAAGLLSA